MHVASCAMLEAQHKEADMQKLYIVNLTEDERSELRDLIKQGKPAARKVARAHILLLADEGATDKAIAASLHVGKATVERTRKRFVEGNLARALNEDPRPGSLPKLGDKQEAFLIATACSTPPAGRPKWTSHNCWPIAWWNSNKLTRSLTRPCGARSKKQTQAVAEKGMVHSDRRRRLRLAHGRCAGPVCRTGRFQTATRLL